MILCIGPESSQPEPPDGDAEEELMGTAPEPWSLIGLLCVVHVCILTPPDLGQNNAQMRRILQGFQTVFI